MTVESRTEVGNYFVSNYPPFSQWKPEYIPEAIEALDQPPRSQRSARSLHSHSVLPQALQVLLLQSLHRQERLARSNVYLDALIKENELYSRMPAFQGRQLRFAYFGGGTPSYISESQLQLSGRRAQSARELGPTPKKSHLNASPARYRRRSSKPLKEIGVTRLSLGVEHFDDEILAANGRAHLRRRSIAPTSGPAKSTSRRSTSI